MYTTTQGVSFRIVTTKSEIVFIDEDGGTLRWEKTLENEILVQNMVYEVTEQSGVVAC